MCSLDNDICWKLKLSKEWALASPFFTTGDEDIRQVWELCHLYGMRPKLPSSLLSQNRKPPTHKGFSFELLTITAHWKQQPKVFTVLLVL
ncbi:hypothetical protein HGM15179_009948 [Zosterops borbonicus]|uniref:Uncharacterized protein n=1 Tax=Zosterops borbonicus TaxID=364589 RepID=A0A8K1GFI1_9PASS|nr:hypothetical protein HGM15179_009948 [Zosterops borbonicus]